VNKSEEKETTYREHPFNLTIKSDGRVAVYQNPFDLKFGEHEPTPKQRIGMLILFLQEIYNNL